MATTRLLLRNSKPLDRCLPSSSSSSSSSFRFASSCCSSSMRTMKCCSLRLGSDGGKSVSRERERRSTVEVKACTSTSENVITREARDGRGLMDLALLVTQVSNVVLTASRQAVKRRPSKLQIQRFVERVIIDFRFFTIFAVAGSLMGSIPCFVEGCFLVFESYFHNFNGLSHVAEEHTMHLLIEAIDMFLLGTSMLVFGMGIYNMFVGSRTTRPDTQLLSKSDLFDLFHLKTLPSWMEMGSISQAKSRIGYAVVMILHVGMLEKFKTTPLLTCLDLACFAASVFISSASMFLFSRLSVLRSNTVPKQ